jgi:ferredoxin
MPAKYVIETSPVPRRFEPVTRSGVIAWEEGCLRCAVCVKTRCIYNVYSHRGLRTLQMIDSIDNECMNCFRCIQSCPKELIHKSLSPEFKDLGDGHWSPDIIARLWYQAETGKIPVSGAGYPGPFSGAGFDSMWTDMSEIVRPTRDGIHGREYISTAVDIGRKPGCLSMDAEGRWRGEDLRIMDIPLPIIMKVPPFGSISDETVKGWAMAAKRLGTLLALPKERLGPEVDGLSESLVPFLGDGVGQDGGVRGDFPFLERTAAGSQSDLAAIHREKPGDAMVIVRLPLTRGIEERALEQAKAGVFVLHLAGSMKGTYLDDDARTLKEGIRSVHRRLVEANLRDRVTVLASGGLAMPEQVAKAMICGADAVYVDFPLLIALECRMCRRCTRGLPCPVSIGEARREWVALRTVNLLGAWHNQLLEVMGAMGIRDARRIRGEVGRAMFFEDLDENTFGGLGELKEGYELE